MKKEDLLTMIEKANGLESEIDKVRHQFKDVKMGQLIKRLTKLSMSKSGVTAEGLGLPENIMEKLEEYQRLNIIIRNALTHVLGAKDELKQ